MKIKKLFNDFEEINLESYLNKKGIKDIEEYLNPFGKYNDKWQKYNHMQDAVNEIKYLINYNDAKIVIVQDSDCDGICSSIILYQYLHNLNPEWDIIMILHQGKIHGLEDVIDNVIEIKPNLVFCPDAGSNNVEEAKILCDNGIGYIVLDHHQLDNPIQHGTLVSNQDDQSDVQREGSGALVTHKFLEALDAEFKLNWSKCVIDLVALSLVSDSCDMSSQENRCYYNYGLETIDCISNGFLYALVDKFIGSDMPYTQRDIAFKIIPKLNSVIRSNDQKLKERITEAFLGYDLEYEDILIKCEEAHSKQIKTVDTVVRKISKDLDKTSDDKIVVISFEEMPKSYSGLICGKVMNLTQKPTIIGKVKDGVFVGSMRSPIELQQALNKNEFVDWARGHECACGIQMQEENISKLVEYYNSLEELPEPEIEVLSSLNIENIDSSLFTEFNQYPAIWGHGVEQPKFHITLTYNPSDYCMEVLGKNQLTVKLFAYGIETMFFYCSKEKKVELGLGFLDDSNKFVYEPKQQDYKLTIIGTLGLNIWGDKITPQIVVDRYEVLPIKAKKIITAKNIFK